VRHGETEPTPEFTESELVAALRAATAEEFGDQAVPDKFSASSEPPAATPVIESRTLLGPRTISQHVVFLIALIVGGFLAALSSGTLSMTNSLASSQFAKLAGSSSFAGPLTLLVGGLLVGFGTRMAGGCTSGHGLCGVSRLQPGSLLATALFFGAGIVTALLIG
jgi:hypothetical protein